ncbi:hypothetical protein OG524_28705 [Streptomyces sp. NBC_01520]|uniref:hypothetical protein n=1 Tax=Streptomyces sp. NBC_01520 TaxID=2903892 RepID=UPI00386BE060
MDVEMKVEGQLGDITLSALQDVIGGLNRLLKGMGGGGEWSLAGLAEGSADLAARPLDHGDADVGHRLLCVVRELEERPEIPSCEDETTVRRVADLTGLVGRRGVAGLRVRTDRSSPWSQAVPLTPAVRMHALQAVKVKVRARSSFQGRLDKVNLRGKTPQFSLFNEARGLALRCNTTDDEVIDQVKRHMGEIVTARGDLSRNASNQPVHLRVDRLKLFEAPQRQVSVEDWAGVAPDWTNGLSSVDFVRRQRDAGASEDGE